MSIEQGTLGWRAGVVMVRLSGEWTARPAVFFFDTPRGWVWVEPSYADPLGAGSVALHERAGQPERAAGAQYFVHASTDGERLEVTEFDPDEDNGDIAEAIEWWEGYLQAAGRTKAVERQRVRAELEQGGTFSL